MENMGKETNRLEKEVRERGNAAQTQAEHKEKLKAARWLESRSSQQTGRSGTSHV